MPIKVLELELSQEIEPVNREGYDRLYILVRYHKRPVGWVHIAHLSQPIISPAQLHQTISKQLGWTLVPVVLGGEHANPAGQSGDVLTPPISVVVCTHDRADQFESCLQALLALDYPDYEIVIVDNHPSGDRIARIAANLSVRYVREKRPGLGWARNAGIAAARHELIAFTTAAACPDRNWLQAIARTFADPKVMAVTGFVAPAELETAAQMTYEFDYGGMSRGFRRQTIKLHGLANRALSRQQVRVNQNWLERKWYDDRKLVWREALTDRDLLWANAEGVGANMAFRRELFAAVGGFDVALGVNMPGSAGDNEIFHRLVARGYTMVYEPAALVWHTYPRDAGSLRRLVYNNGRSFGAFLLTCAQNHTVRRRSILSFAIREWLGKGLIGRLFKPGKLPRSLVALELAGALLSPLAYWTAQAQVRQLVRRSSQKSESLSEDRKVGSAEVVNIE
jgi:glycosyltransferase involved in cell wall biosynthesis